MILRSSGISGILLPGLSWKCYLFSLSQKLQVDVGKVNEEKTLLSSIVKNTQGREITICNFKSPFKILEENKVLSKVMEKISSEYDELKKVYSKFILIHLIFKF